jgi:hypothetical protein
MFEFMDEMYGEHCLLMLKSPDFSYSGRDNIASQMRPLHVQPKIATIAFHY